VIPSTGDLRLARRIVARQGKRLFLGGRDVQAPAAVNQHVHTVYQLTLSNGELSGTGSWSQVASGGKPIWESTAATVVGDKFLFFGGQFNGHTGSSGSASFEVGLHAFDLSLPTEKPKWYSRGANDNRGVSGAGPSPREDSAMTAIGRFILVHGGYSYQKGPCCTSALGYSDCVNIHHNGQLLGDLWMFDTENNTWTDLGPGPPVTVRVTQTLGIVFPTRPRHQHGMVSLGGKAFLFGGRASTVSPPSPCVDNCVRDNTAQDKSLYSFNMTTRYDEI